MSRTKFRSSPAKSRCCDTVVDYVVEEPYGSHPSYAQGYYDRDNQVNLDWNRQSETHESTLEWLDEWVNDVENRMEYLEILDTKRFVELQPQSNYATPIDMGGY